MVELRALADQSEAIAEAVSRAPAGKYTPGETAQEWLMRRVKAQRVTNYKVRQHAVRRCTRGADGTRL